MLEKGLKHISRTVVQPDNFALTMGSGDLPVLATPALVALMENAAMLAVAAELPEGATTVGAKMDMTQGEMISLCKGIKNDLTRCFVALFPESFKTMFVLAGLLTCSVFECLPIR